jgi:hypothetical protein
MRHPSPQTNGASRQARAIALNLIVRTSNRSGQLDTTINISIEMNDLRRNNQPEG